MIRSLLPLAISGLLQASSVLAQDAVECSLDKKCPRGSPCCSQYGQCGVGAYCLGGCDPRMSFSLDSCVPAPVCQSKTYSMDSTDGIMSVSEYLGDPSSADWVMQGDAAAYKGNVILTMPPQSVGTVLASTAYMWYGSVKAKLKTSLDAGVVTAFILLSDVKDEIDYEFVGVDLETAQTNYYFQGIPNYDQSANISLSNTYENFHDFEIEWTPDEITWFVDGQKGRTKKREDTWNDTANQWDYPQTPARVQLSIWPGGADTNGQGTIDWAGGPINWDSEYIKKTGYYFATVGEVEIKCYDADSPPGTNKGTSYWYNDKRATNDTVEDGDKPTVLKSLAGTGLNMDQDDNESDSSSGQSQVPGGSSTGPGTSPSNDEEGSGDQSSTNSQDCGGTAFAQNCGGSDDSNDGATGLERLTGTSIMVVVVAVSALIWL